MHMWLQSFCFINMRAIAVVVLNSIEILLDLYAVRVTRVYDFCLIRPHVAYGVIFDLYGCNFLFFISKMKWTL